MDAGAGGRLPSLPARNAGEHHVLAPSISPIETSLDSMPQRVCARCPSHSTSSGEVSFRLVIVGPLRASRGGPPSDLTSRRTSANPDAALRLRREPSLDFTRGWSASVPVSARVSRVRGSRTLAANVTWRSARGHQRRCCSPALALLGCNNTAFRSRSLGYLAAVPGHCLGPNATLSLFDRSLAESCRACHPSRLES